MSNSIENGLVLPDIRHGLRARSNKCNVQVRLMTCAGPSVAPALVTTTTIALATAQKERGLNQRKQRKERPSEDQNPDAGLGSRAKKRICTSSISSMIVHPCLHPWLCRTVPTPFPGSPGPNEPLPSRGLRSHRAKSLVCTSLVWASREGRRRIGE